MRKTIGPAIGIVFVILILISSPLRTSNAREANETKGKSPTLQAEPGTRCTRVSWPKEKKPTGEAGRCPRLWTGARKGEFLPNVAPKLGLSSSSSYLAAGAPAEVKLRAIACDLDGDNLLYTFTATGGRITGEGADAVWNMGGVAPGTYTVTVEVDDGCGCESFLSSEVTIAGS